MKTAKIMRQINFNPWNANILDYLEKELININGEKVKISQSLNCFIVYVNGEIKYKNDDNINICAFLNTMETGYDD